MTADAQVSEQTRQYFLQEAIDLLRIMDDELQDLRENFSLQKIHNLMRAAHTLKGASASTGLDTVTKTAHSLEDIFRALCYEDTIVSVETERLVFEGYECLQLLMSSQLAGAKIEGADILDRMAGVVSQLQLLLGDRFGQDGHLPTSSELGFDLTQSIFEVGVAQRIEALAEALEHPDPTELLELLPAQMEVFIGLAESLDLPGFEAIAQMTLKALEQHPDDVLAIAPVALENFRDAQAAVLGGDRQQGGTPSPALRQLCDAQVSVDESADAQLVDAAGDTAGGFDSQAVAINQAVIAPRTSWLKRRWQALTHSNRSPAERSTDRLHSDQIHSDQNHDIGTSAAVQADQTEPFMPGLAAVGVGNAQINQDDEISAAIALDLDEELDFADTDTDTDTDTDSEELAELTPVELGSLAIRPLKSSLGITPNTEPEQLTAPLDASDPAAENTRESRNSSSTIRMTVEHLNQLSQTMGELLTEQNRQTLYNEQLTRLIKRLLGRISQQQQQLNRHKEQSISHRNFLAGSRQPTAIQSSSSPDYASFDALELDQYSDIQLLVQSCLEETVQQSESAEAIELFVRRSGQALEKQKRLLANTRETLLTARMVPLEKVFRRLPSIVERLQAQHHKQVEVQVEGGDVLVDKVIVDKLYEPLLHLIRNAFDHGIESLEERQAQSKFALSNITIEGIQRGHHLLIHVIDNGRGLDLEMIRRRAVEKQLITATEAATLTPEQTVDLLFEVGFSTVREVDDLSGRGVGLDAVRAQVRSLKGWVIVNHEPGSGTCFTLQIPSALTIAKLLLCQAQGRTYALIADAIEHILIPTFDQIRAWEGGKMLTWQTGETEHLIPVLALCDVLHYASPASNHQPIAFRQGIKSDKGEVSNPVILLHYQDALVGLEVDQLGGEQELVISPLGETIVPPAYLYGSSILPDGQLTLVLDGMMLAKIISAQRSRSSLNNKAAPNSAPSAAANNGQTPSTPAQDKPIFLKKLVLTVDDSITVRNALSEALQRANYQVIQARDGAEALAQLERYPDVQAILCDIEMPGMNGFEFLKARQQIDAIATIPTVMLTSRAGTKHRLLTEELGATTYITKPYLTPLLLKTLAEAIESQAENQTYPQPAHLEPSIVGEPL